MNLQSAHQLWQLSRRRINSEADYRTFQAYQAELVLRYMRKHGVDVAGKRVLDVGSGIGGYSVEMARQGAHVISIDLMRPTYPPPERNVAVQASGLAIPLEDAAAEFVFCASLIEHVPAPGALLAELARVLEPGGVCYLSFPPFYSPMGGHEFAPFHYLGERAALRLSGRRKREVAWVNELYNVSSDPDSFAALYDDWGLYRMTVAKARHLIRAGGWCILDMSTRYLPFSFIRWPLVGEVLTWHAQFLLVNV